MVTQDEQNQVIGEILTKEKYQFADQRLIGIVIRDAFEELEKLQKISIQKNIKCVDCGKEVSADEVYRDGECRACRFADKSSEMGVGDISSR